MLKKMSITLLGAGLLFSASTAAFSTLVTRSFYKDYTLKPNQVLSPGNSYGLELTITCTIETPDPSDIIRVHILHGGGTINGQALTAPNEIDIVVHTGESFILSSEKNTEISLLNLGQNEIKARCALS